MALEILRKVEGVTKMDRIRSDDIRGRLKQEDVLETMLSSGDKRLKEGGKRGNKRKKEREKREKKGEKRREKKEKGRKRRKKPPVFITLL